MELKNAPYYRMWQNRYKPFMDGNWYLYMEFSPRYFAKLKRELESAGYEVTIDKDGIWHSLPVGAFGIASQLRGESFVFFTM
jgi:hypothetical protein